MPNFMVDPNGRSIYAKQQIELDGTNQTPSNKA
jgi:hypothetical protein